MGRPLHKKFFGNRNIGSASTAGDNGIGGQGIASITLGAANNSSSYTAGGTQITMPNPSLPGGVTATASLVVGPAGAFLTIAATTSGTNVSTFTATGTGAAVTGTFTGLVQKVGGTTTGSGATFTITKATAGTNYATGGVLTVITASSKGTGYVVGDTIVIDGALIGGVTITNDITLTVVGAVAAAGTITGITITEPGSGYTTVPAVTLNTGTQGTLTVTAALAVDTGPVGSVTNQENAITVFAFVTGGSRKVGDIIKQVSGTRYKVRTADGIMICKLKASAASAAGEMDIQATDAAAGTYFVTKLTSHRARLTQGTGVVFANDTSHPWTLGTATATVAKIPNA